MHIYINTYIDRGLLSSPPFAAQCYSLPSASLPMHWSIVNIPQKYLIPSESAKIACTHIWAHVYICKLCLFVYSYSFCLLAAAYCHALYYGFFFFLFELRQPFVWAWQEKCCNEYANVWAIQRIDGQTDKVVKHSNIPVVRHPTSHSVIASYFTCHSESFLSACVLFLVWCARTFSLQELRAPNSSSAHVKA